MSLKKHQFLWLMACIAMLLASVFLPRPPQPGLWLRALFDWLHVPVFGLLAVALYLLTPRHWPAMYRFGAAFLGGVFLGVVTEAIQIPMRRDASWEDIIADSLGAFSFLLLVFALRRGFVQAGLAVIAALSILTVTALPLIAATQAIIHREVQFPILFNGDMEAERLFVSEKNVRLTTHWPASVDRPYSRAEVTGEGAPRIVFHDLSTDWSGHRNLLLDIEIEGSEGFELTIRVHDRWHRRGGELPNDRFSQRLILVPGPNRVLIPLETIRNAPESRFLDLTHLGAIIIYGRDIEPGRAFRIHEIRLD